MNPNLPAFVKLMMHPLKARVFLFSKLPSAYFSGVRVRELDAEHCMVTVPFKWFSQNPFRSTYFACLAMAAEMSNGALAMAHLHGRKPSVSMLVVKLEANYFKKATGRTRFTCTEGTAFNNAIEESIATGEARSVAAKSTGINDAGETVAEFIITWSFKAKPSI